MHSSTRSRVLGHLRSQWAGLLSLFLVIAGGTAYAANTIGSSDIINGEVKSVDIGNNQVQSVDVRDGTLSGADVGQLQIVNFTGTIGVVNGSACDDKKVTGLPLDNKDHLVLTPDVTTAKRDLTYTPEFDGSETGDMWIQVCNHTSAPIDDGTTKFNLLMIDAD